MYLFTDPKFNYHKVYYDKMPLKAMQMDVVADLSFDPYENDLPNNNNVPK